MLTNRDDDDGLVRVLDGDKLVKPFAYDTRDRKSQKAAHECARAFIEGAAYALSQLTPSIHERAA